MSVWTTGASHFCRSKEVVLSFTPRWQQAGRSQGPREVCCDLISPYQQSQDGVRSRLGVPRTSTHLRTKHHPFVTPGVVFISIGPVTWGTYGASSTFGTKSRVHAPTERRRSSRGLEGIAVRNARSWKRFKSTPTGWRRRVAKTASRLNIQRHRRDRRVGGKEAMVMLRSFLPMWG